MGLKSFAIQNEGGGVMEFNFVPIRIRQNMNNRITEIANSIMGWHYIPSKRCIIETFKTNYIIANHVQEFVINKKCAWAEFVDNIRANIRRRRMERRAEYYWNKHRIPQNVTTALKRWW